MGLQYNSSDDKLLYNVGDDLLMRECCCAGTRCITCTPPPALIYNFSFSGLARDFAVFNGSHTVEWAVDPSCAWVLYLGEVGVSSNMSLFLVTDSSTFWYWRVLITFICDVGPPVQANNKSWKTSTVGTVEEACGLELTTLSEQACTDNAACGDDQSCDDSAGATAIVTRA